MSSITYEFKASYAFIERNFNIVKRYWAWEVVWLVYGIVNSLSVSFIGVGASSWPACRTEPMSTASPTPTATRSGRRCGPTARCMRNGMMEVGDGPGFGIELDWKMVERYRVA